MRSPFSLAAAGLALLLLAPGCPQTGDDDDDDSTIGDDDDDSTPGDDDDDTTPGDDDDDDTSPPDGNEETIEPAELAPGTPLTIDVWEIEANGAITLTVDTTAAETAFDPFLGQFLVPGDYSEENFAQIGDDEVPCTFPPPTFACPQAEVTDGGTLHIVVSSFGDAIDPAVGAYVLNITGDATATLIEDDMTWPMPTTEIDCGDGVDNDKDGLTDCDDTEDCAETFECGPGVEVDCADGVDNDFDGATDCLDDDCAEAEGCELTTVDGSLAPCHTGEEGINTIDTYTVVVTGASAVIAFDTVDAETAADLAAFSVATAALPIEDLGLLGDDDFDCTFPPPDWSCPQFTLETGTHDIAVEALSGGDGSTCTDPALANYQLRIIGEATATLVTDDASFPPPPEDCEDGEDNNDDGLVDCDDPLCFETFVCGPGVEEDCTDGLDNDFDGATDCRDDDCAEDEACEVSTTEGSLAPCDREDGGDTIDTYTVEVTGSAIISADTVDAETAADLAIWSIDSAETPTENLGTLGDDEFDCTFPPPDWACPETTLEEGTHSIAVVAFSGAETCTDPAQANYALSVIGTATVTLVSDDFGFGVEEEPPAPE